MLTYIFQSVSQTKPNEANQLCNNFCFLNPIYFYTTEELDRDKYFGSLYITWLFELVISYFWKHIPFHCFAPCRWSNLLHLLRSSVCTILPQEWFYSLESLQHTVFSHVPCQPADSRYHLWSRGTIHNHCLSSHPFACGRDNKWGQRYSMLWSCRQESSSHHSLPLPDRLLKSVIKENWTVPLFQFILKTTQGDISYFLKCA